MPRPQLNSYEKKLRKEISNNLKRLSQGMTQNQISNKTGIPSSTISGYFAQRSTINAGNAQKLATLFNVSIDEIDPRFKEEIFSNDGLLDQINTTSSKLTPPRQQKVLTYANKQLEEQNKVTSLDGHRKKVTVKRVHAAAAGVTGEELFEDLLEEEIEFYEDEVPNGTDFCVLVNGDSMEPAIREGTYAFFKEVHEINDGGIALVTLDGAGFIKRVDKYYDHIELISINPKYDSITVSSYNQFKVIGKLVM